MLVSFDKIHTLIMKHVFLMTIVLILIVEGNLDFNIKLDKIRDLFKVKLYAIRSETKKEREREKKRGREREREKERERDIARL